MPKLRRTIGVAGSRRRNGSIDLHCLVVFLLDFLQEGDRLVSGGCKEGADRFAEIIARDRGLTITIHYPDWKKLGRGAGLERNTQIAEDCDILIAMPASDRKGGTEDTIRKAEALGKEVILL